ncbi:MAG: bifunctional glutamate N-acetyltransferase/amino-acid acetyltransferase ArgJ [Actinomycetota bacterium]|nr:bifunctional glutamate N-acetyltransferase/amino-acid acetyltransferase ArgJ [Actinomycetota bacterium]
MTSLPKGFRATGVAAGLKPSGAVDLGLLVSEMQATAAGVFTTNRVAAAPVQLSRRHLRRGVARAVVVNSGNANAATGSRGLADARAMAKTAGSALGLRERDVLVASTGIIGVYMPIAKVLTGIGAAAGSVSAGGLDHFATAIMTTDTRMKVAEASAGNARLVGVAKGAGMIAPEMATMLCFIATDAEVDRGVLYDSLHRATSASFNLIDVDGCRSTNDCIFVLANGAAGPVDGEAFEAALVEVCRSLARQVVEDAEGATKVVAITVRSASNVKEARKAAAAIASSLLLRCALAGADPNWGRVLAALGVSNIPFDPAVVDVWLGGEKVCERGAPGPGDVQKAGAAMGEREIEIIAELNRGGAEATVLTNDITAEYIRLNTEYTT